MAVAKRADWSRLANHVDGILSKCLANGLDEAVTISLADAQKFLNSGSAILNKPRYWKKAWNKTRFRRLRIMPEPIFVIQPWGQYRNVTSIRFTRR